MQLEDSFKLWWKLDTEDKYIISSTSVKIHQMIQEPKWCQELEEQKVNSMIEYKLSEIVKK